MSLANVFGFAGEVKVNTTLLDIPGRFPFQLTTQYRGQVSDLRPVATGDFGVDWAFSYSDDRLFPDGPHVVHFGPKLRTDMFIADTTPGTFIAPIEYYQQLQINNDGDFELRDQDGTVNTYRRFSDPNIPGRLVRMEDRDGNFMTFHYERIDPDNTRTGDEKHVLAFVIDTLGREIRYQYYARTSQTVGGRLVTIPHPAGNAGAFGRLARVIDFKGNPDFTDTPESEDFPEQANNRTVSFDYDAEGNLIAVTSPAVQGTPTGNDFPDGKTTRYDYLRQADIPTTITGTDRERLLHNLIAIQAANETALDPANPNLTNPREILSYATNPNDPATFDRALSQSIGGTNASGVPSGGTLRYSYEIVAPVAPTTNHPFLQTTVTDRRGNVTAYTYSIFDTLLEKREFTRGFRNFEPESFVTRYRYNMDKEMLQEIMPQGNIIDSFYDQDNADRFQQGNLVRTVATPDTRGGDQRGITSETVYEPIYQQAAAVTDPRGLDPDFVPPVADLSPRTQRERYTTRFFFDYQEADPAVVLPLLAAELGTTVAEVQARLSTAGIQLGLGDLNGDDIVAVDIQGDVVRSVMPSVVLLPGSNQAVIEGDRLQDIVTLFRFNPFGQMTLMVDPEGNVTEFTYFPETDPDGDTLDDDPTTGAPTPTPADGRSLHPSTGGYLREQRRDTTEDPPSVPPLRNNRTNPPAVNIRTRFQYDDVGNVIRMTDGRGIHTDFFVNELDQVVQTLRAADVSGTTAPDINPVEPVLLDAFRYLANTFYDFNDNVVLTQVEDRGNTSRVDGNPQAAELPAGVPGASNPDPVGGTAFVDMVYKYDILDNRIEMLEEVLNPSAGVPQLPNGEFLRTCYRFDRNENQVLTILPEGNATAAIYDERDLLFRTTRGALTPPELEPGAPAATSTTLLSAADRAEFGDPPRFDARGGINCQCTTFHYDLNGNVIETVDAADTDLSSLNNSRLGGPGDRTRYIYDGFDRQTSVIDSVGNQTVYQYDPASNIVRASRFGPVGGSSPVSDGPDVLLGPVSIGGVIQSVNLVNANLMESTESVYDELSRAFQTDRVLFVNTIPTVRPPDVADGGIGVGDDKIDLTPDDNQSIPGIGSVTILGRVTTRTEYDRSSRTTFTIEDDGDTSRMDYDGADRVRRTRDPEGNMVETAYDDNSNVIEARETDVAQVLGIASEVFLTTFFYDSLDRLQQSTDNLGQTMFYRYDSRDNLVAMADAQGPPGPVIARRAFTGGLLTVNTTNLFGNVTRYFYDGISRQTRQDVILRPLPLPTLRPATASGDGVHIGATLEGIKDLVGAEESFTPPADINQGGKDGIIRTGSVYDKNSLLTALIDDQGNVTLYLYDNLNRRVTETKGLVVNSEYTYENIFGERVILTPTVATINDPDFIPPEQVQRQLDAASGRITTVASLFPSSADRVDDRPPTTIVYGFDPDDDVLILEDENDSEVFTKFDAINRPIAVRVFRSEGNPASRPADSHAGDPIFAPAPVRDPRNPSALFPAVVGTNKQDFEYDGLSHLTRATDNNEPGITSTSDDSVITYAYDSLSRVIEETQRIGDDPSRARAISSAWRAENLRSRLIYPNDRGLVYQYDRLDRLDKIRDEGVDSFIVDYDYIGVSRVLVRSYPINGTRMTYLNDAGTADMGYDGLRRPVRLRHLRADNSLIVGFTHTYDRMNNKLTEGKLHDSANSEVYTYDSAYRLIDFGRPTVEAIAPLHSDWKLDGVGNWQLVVTTEFGAPVTETREHSSFNELIHREDGPPIDLNYDDNGNQTDDGTLSFQWDYRNRLRAVTRDSGGALVAVYDYDAVDRRIRKVVTSSGALDGTTDFYLDGDREIEERNGPDALKQQYVYGVYIDELLVFDRNLDGGSTATESGDQRLFSHENSQFSGFALSDTAGNIVEGYQYDAYGRQTVFQPGVNGMVDFGGDDVVTVGDASGVGNPYLYNGRRLDPETDLYYYRRRFLDTQQGRFISRDPAEYTDGLNLYEAYFVVNWLDPFGLAVTLSWENVVAPKKDGNCGAFKWQIRWKLTGTNAKTTGYIVQKVTWDVDRTTCSPENKDTSWDLTYTEAWLVRANAILGDPASARADNDNDYFQHPDNPKTCGSIIETGWAKFLSKWPLPAGMKPNQQMPVGNPPVQHAPAGVLPAMQGTPADWNDSGAVKRFIATGWDCCPGPKSWLAWGATASAEFPD